MDKPLPAEGGVCCGPILSVRAPLARQRKSEARAVRAISVNAGPRFRAYACNSDSAPGTDYRDVIDPTQRRAQAFASRWVHGPHSRHRHRTACALAPALAEEGATPQQCWTLEALAGTPAEIKHQLAKGPLDVAALKATPLPLAAPVETPLRGLIESVTLPPDKKLIALSFDLCEESGYVSGYEGRIIDLLRAQGVKATFFAGGKWMETHPERATQLIADPLFEVGSHGLKHVDLSRASDAVIKDEVTLTEAAYARAKANLAARECVVGDAPPAPPERLALFRFPYGRCNAKALAAVGDAGLLAVQWDVVTGDPDPRVSAKTIARTILARAHPGAIVVGHANARGRNTAAALALALPKLKEQGYRFVTVSELIAAGKPVIAQRCTGPGLGKRVARASRRQGTHDLFSVFNRRH